MTAAQATPGPQGQAQRLPSPEARFSQLYNDYFDQVYGYCLRRTSRANAQDVTAEVFTVAWRKVSEIPPGEVALSWLYGVAYRVVSHHWRSRRRFHNLVNRVGGLRQEVSPDPEAQVVRRTEDRRVVEAVRRLTETDQEILRLAGWEALPHDEIGSVLGISVAAVDQRFSRAKQRLAREYDRKGVRPPDVQEGGR